jgi:hypothetical protein
MRLLESGYLSGDRPILSCSAEHAAEQATYLVIDLSVEWDSGLPSESAV